MEIQHGNVSGWTVLKPRRTDKVAERERMGRRETKDRGTWGVPSQES